MSMEIDDINSTYSYHPGGEVHILHAGSEILQVSKDGLGISRDDYEYDPVRSIITFKEPLFDGLVRNSKRRWWQFWKPKYVRVVYGEVKIPV